MAKQSRGRETTERVLEAALAVYGEAGRDGFNVQAISARSEASVGSIYHHFGSLAGVARALYRSAMVRLLDAILAELREVSGAPAGVAALVRGYLGWVRANATAARFLFAWGDSGFGIEPDAELAGLKGERLAAITGWFAPHIAAGAMVALPEPLPEMLLIGPLAELSRRWLHGAADIDLDAATALLPERLWWAVAAGPVRA